MIRVKFPPVLRAVGAREIDVEGCTVREALDNAAKQIPALRLHLFDESGNVRRHILCIHDSSVVRGPEMAVHRVDAGDEIVLANAFAGG